MEETKPKTYILKCDVYNNETFPIGTIVTITDDYWGKGSNTPNTGFTVTEGKQKGEKGCVADGLKTYLIEDTRENRNLVKEFQSEEKKLNDARKSLNKKWDALPNAKLPSPPKP